MIPPPSDDFVTVRGETTAADEEALFVPEPIRRRVCKRDGYLDRIRIPGGGQVHYRRLFVVSSERR
jgi:hypothetical protein